MHFAYLNQNFIRKGLIHFVGIGGIGMNGIAEILFRLGCRIQGSDQRQSFITKRLEKLEIKIFDEHNRQHIKNSSVVVYSSMIESNNCELLEASRLGIPAVLRAEMLAELMPFYQTVAVAGTHGKTTTTSLISCILSEPNFDPTVVVGGIVKKYNSNAYLGKQPYLVAEADESDASFLRFHPTLSVVTNIDDDHLDNYQNKFGSLCQAFVNFMHNLPIFGKVVLCGEDPAIRSLLPSFSRRYTTYGFSKDNCLWTENIRFFRNCTSFYIGGVNFTNKHQIILNTIGQHNVLNALAAIAAALELEINMATIYTALRKFQGIKRCLERCPDLWFSNQPSVLIDDYAHHPKEIYSTIQAVRRAWPNKKITVVLQPHRYSRTQSLLPNFAPALSEADQLLLMPIYAAGKPPVEGLDTQLYASLQKILVSLLCYKSVTEEKYFWHCKTLPGKTTLYSHWEPATYLGFLIN